MSVDSMWVFSYVMNGIRALHGSELLASLLPPTVVPLVDAGTWAAYRASRPGNLTWFSAMLLRHKYRGAK